MCTQRSGSLQSAGCSRARVSPTRTMAVADRSPNRRRLLLAVVCWSTLWWSASASASTDPTGVETGESSDRHGRRFSGVPASCWERVVTGRRLHPQFIIRSVSASSLQDCQHQCEDVLFHCETIAYGVNRFRNTSCDLSDWEAGHLSVHPQSSDTIESATYVIFSRYEVRAPTPSAAAGQRCSGVALPAAPTRPPPTPPPAVESWPPYRPPAYATSVSEDVCYSQMYVGRRLGQRYIERSISVISLEECKLLCNRETAFDCRSFNYKDRESGTNCDLSREDADSLPTGALTSTGGVFYADAGTDYYQRVGRGPQCAPAANGAPSDYENVPVRPAYAASALYSPAVAASSSSASECFRRLKMGYRLESRMVRQAMGATSVEECHWFCARSRNFACRSFSFRFPSPPVVNSPWPQPVADGKNCALSDLEGRQLDPVRHLVVDRSADIYERTPSTSSTCRPYESAAAAAAAHFAPPKPTGHSSNKPLNNNPQCFERVKTGLRLDRKSVRYTLTVKSPLECEQECLNIQFFTCRAFSYRFSEAASLSEAYHKANDNCDLSDVEWNSLDPVYDILVDANYDSWQRFAYDRECDVKTNRVPDNNGPEDWNHGPVASSYWYQRPTSRPPPLDVSAPASGCYIMQRRGVRMSLRIVRESLVVRDLAECELECTKSRSFKCETFHFRTLASQGSLSSSPFNCELSDLSARGIDQRRDLIEDADVDLFSRLQHSACSWQPSMHPPNVLASSGSSSLYPSGSTTSASSSSFYGHRPEDVTTVGGLKCRAGSSCRANTDGSYWFCETGMDTSSWDYCCRPGRQCAYTEGTPFPWCYVGTDSNSQWRPCSERLVRAAPTSAPVHGGRPSGKEVDATPTDEAVDGAANGDNQRPAPFMETGANATAVRDNGSTTTRRPTMSTATP